MSTATKAKLVSLISELADQKRSLIGGEEMIERQPPWRRLRRTGGFFAIAVRWMCASISPGKRVSIRRGPGLGWLTLRYHHLSEGS